MTTNHHRVRSAINPNQPFVCPIRGASLALLAFLAIMALSGPTSIAVAQGTAFSYQGRLNDGGNQASGNYDLRFTIYDSLAIGNLIAGPVTNTATVVSNGLFTVTVDFGSGVFTGPSRWLEISVRTNGGVAFSTLTPRQPLMPTPYAIMANGSSNLLGNLPATQLSGTLPTALLPGAVVTNNSSGVALNGNFSGSGVGLAGVNAAFLNGMNVSNLWQVGGNNVGAGQFIGSTNNQAVEIRVNGGRAARFAPDPNGWGAPNVIHGSPSNSVLSGMSGAVIGGGGAPGLDGGRGNTVTFNFGTVAGGRLNSADTVATVGGGIGNVASGGESTISGGGGNIANALASTVAGGENNTAYGQYGTVGGGTFNSASGVSATVPGGLQNTASGRNSFAAGRGAGAFNDGAFVWADSQSATFSSTSTNQFLIRAGGGVGINTNYPGTNALQVVGTVAATRFVGDGSGLTGVAAGGAGTVTNITTGAGLTGGPITSSGTISISNGGVLNSMLANSSVTVAAGTGLSGGGSVSLGGTVALSNQGVLSISAAAPLSSSGGQNPTISMSGTISVTNLPAAVVTNNQSGVNLIGTFSGDGSNLNSLSASSLASGTVPLARLTGITSDQLSAATWQLATNLNGGNAALASNLAPGVTISSALITNSSFAGDGTGLTNVNLTTAFPSGVISLVPRRSFLATSYPLGDNVAISLAAADVNGDGSPDLIVANNNGNVIVFTNNGAGHFVSNAIISVGAGASFVTAADLNGDGKPDLAVADGSDNYVRVLTNDGSGGFVTSLTLTSTTPICIIAADVNGDGKLDLVAVNQSANSLTIWTNGGNGSFVLQSSPAVGTTPYSVTAVDVNGDGRIDLISADGGANTLTVLTNSGAGFVLSQAYPVGTGPVFVTAADVNGDGKADLVCANSGSANLTVLTNNADGTFTVASSPPVGAAPYGIAVADINGDGKLDLVCANNGDGSISILTNSGNGSFAVLATLSGVTQAFAVLAKDVNGDAVPDVVSANAAAETVTVFLNNPMGLVPALNGDGSGLTNLDAAHISGTLADSQLSPNVALLNSSPAFSGNVTASSFIGDGSGLTGLNFVAKTGDTMSGPLNVAATVTAGSFVGDGSGLTGLNASQLASGLVPLAQLPSVLVTNGANALTLSGSFIGNGGGLTNLNYSAITNPPIFPSIANLALTNDTRALSLGNSANQFGGSFSGNGAGLTNLSGSQVVSGTVPLGRLPAAVITNGASGLALSGTFSGSGAGLLSLNATNLTSGTVPTAALANAWTTTGNSSASPTNGNFLGTTDNQPFEIRVNNSRAMRMEPSALGPDYGANFIAGWSGNLVVTGVVGAAISGGGQSGAPNIVSAHFGVVGGGNGNTAAGTYATVAGGSGNAAAGSAAVVGGGNGNSASGVNAVVGGGFGNSAFGNYPTVGGGSYNVAGSDSAIGGGLGNASYTFFGTIAGGYSNAVIGLYGTIAGGSVNAANTYATVAGGNGNNAGVFSSIGGGEGNAASGLTASIGGGFFNQANGAYSAVPGGFENAANGDYSFAAGQRAKANHQGSFVWADSTTSDFSSTGNDQFSVRANGGVGFLTGGAGMTLDNAPVLTGGAGNTNQGSLSFVGSGQTNSVSSGAADAVIAGGYLNVVPNSGSYAAIGGGQNNTAGGYDSFIGGGQFNTTQPSASYSTIGGGVGNSASAAYSSVEGGYGNIAGGQYATIGGGNANAALSSFDAVAGGLQNIASRGYSFSGGGYQNSAAGGYATVGGGLMNYVGSQASVIAGGYNNRSIFGADDSFIGGGNLNTNFGAYSTIPGGDRNSATNNAFAAGHRAKAQNIGSFVWADSTDADFSSTGSNQFLIRASGGVGINTSNPGTNALQVVGSVAATKFIGDGSGLIGINIGGSGSVTNIATGAGLTGGPITTSGTIAIANGGVVNSMLANSTVSVTTGPGLSGGGTVSLGGSISVTNQGVLSVGATAPLSSSGGQNPSISLTGVIPISNLPNAVITNNGTGVTLSGAFSGNAAGLTNLPLVALQSGGATNAQILTWNGTTWAASNAPAGGGSGGGVSSNYSGGVTFTNNGNIFVGAFTGNGGALTNLNGSQITSGTLADTRLSANVALLSGSPSFAGTVTAGLFSGNGGSLTNLNLANIVPTGAITVTAPKGSSFGSTTFYALGLASTPVSVAVADVNNDGKPDAILMNNNGSLVIYTNAGAGNFVSNTSYSIGTGGSFVSAADLNGDGKPDLAIADATDNYVKVLTNNGNGVFVTSATLAASSALCVIAADVNADGWPDLVAVNQSAAKLIIWTNNGSGSFVLQSSPSIGATPYAVTAADVNGDGKLDLISADGGASTVTVLTNTGTGFLLSHTYAVGAGPVFITSADLNGDGKADIITANSGSANLTVLTNTGSGLFATASSPAVGNAPYGIGVADFDGDGRLDLVSANNTDGSLTVLTNAGNGFFATLTNITGVTQAFAVVARDLNGDGVPDIISADAAGHNFAVVLNQPKPSGVIFTGNGSGLTNLSTTNIVGILADAQLSSNIPRLNGGSSSFQAFSGMNSFSNTANVFYGTFNSTSDRNLKENLFVANAQEILTKVAALPVFSWNYKGRPEEAHLGPVAQDFHTAFGLGPDDKTISTVDEGGVALAAIQGLNQRLQEKDAEIQNLKQRLEAVEKLLSHRQLEPAERRR